MSETLRFSASVETAFIEEGFDPAYFVTLPEAATSEVAAYRLASGQRGGFGSLRITARIGGSEWQTTLNAGGGGWSLPIRKPVRLAEAISEGDLVQVEIELP
ncbi:MAG TPA: DUF1905 domain-containing protein [Erythrobacter sp.]|nr:DUF1905 domain-containing protein [Erythrobacter sp.]